jgi:3-methylcrotonyl-CoA carboxylase alpha subunit
MFRKLLIANRGEIACRIICTARAMGILTVAVYSEADQHCLHVQQADEAYCIGPAPAVDSYLNIPAILKAAQHCGAEAIHPGYGFLSENSDFAKACAQANIVFIGPSIQALEIMGSKQLAKQHLLNSSVPLIPGYHGEDQSDQHLLTEAQKIGFPLLIKAAHGGGGKGMRDVYTPEAFLTELAAARREALACFANDTIILEKLIQSPRHVELQIMADNFGHVVHLFERDCSIQRRHQKVIEEAPAAQLDPALRQRMTEAAIAVAKAIAYRGAGTVECLVENNQHFYFMEMNTRLQVEHPVTEMITGLDLVAWQIKIAANDPLPCSQADIAMQGHAIECRVYAEDPANQFLPSTGQIRFLRASSEPGIRIDTGIDEHSNISMFYDPMLAKIIAWGETREQATQRMVNALQHYHLGGVKTNQSFLLGILQHPEFAANTYTTHFLSTTTIEHPETDLVLALSFATAIDYAALQQTLDPIYQASFGWQMHIQSEWVWRYRHQEQSISVRITPHSLQQYTITFLDLTAPSRECTISCTEDRVSLTDRHASFQSYYDRNGDHLTIYLEQGLLELEHITAQHGQSDRVNDAQLTAPMPGTIVAVLKQLGEPVALGEALMVLEAMKMEHTIRAPYAGTLQEIFYPIGTQVQEGATLAALEPS